MGDTQTPAQPQMGKTQEKGSPQPVAQAVEAKADEKERLEAAGFRLRNGAYRRVTVIVPVI